MTVRKRVIVSGRVQGVFFRDSTRRVATEAGVAGTVSNLPDGTVEIVLEGEDDAVESVTAWARRGPPWADVTTVKVIDEDLQGLEGFRIV